MCFPYSKDCRNLHTYKYGVHINIERCATHARFASEPDFVHMLDKDGYNHSINNGN